MEHGVIVPGYFEVMQNRTGDVRLIRVPCPLCTRWHTHGDGKTSTAPTPVGQTVSRIGHCLYKTSEGFDIVIQEPCFRKTWETPAGRISKKYREYIEKNKE